ncbi:MAG: hypothetical protein ABFS09_09565 [Thermodesulfobacteriota bacterium]
MYRKRVPAGKALDYFSGKERRQVLFQLIKLLPAIALPALASIFSSLAIRSPNSLQPRFSGLPFRL